MNIKSPLDRYVYVVDDDDLTRDMLQRILKRVIVRVETSSSGEEALNYLTDSDCPHLLVVDYVMPDMDGLEFISKIKRKCTDIKSILITGSERDIVEDALQNNFIEDLDVQEVIDKPFEKDKLLDILENVLNQL